MPPADLILKNAGVVTMDPTQPRASLVPGASSAGTGYVGSACCFRLNSR